MSPSVKNRQSFGPRREKPRYLHVVIGFAFVFFVYLLCHTLDEYVLISIIIFNLLSVILTFPLAGPLWCKIIWLGFGNIVGLTWNLIRLSLMMVALEAGGFRALNLIVGPVIDFIWIVPIWSLGLSALASAELRRREVK